MIESRYWVLVSEALVIELPGPHPLFLLWRWPDLFSHKKTWPTDTAYRYSETAHKKDSPHSHLHHVQRSYYCWYPANRSSFWRCQEIEWCEGSSNCLSRWEENRHHIRTKFLLANPRTCSLAKAMTCLIMTLNLSLFYSISLGRSSWRRQQGCRLGFDWIRRPKQNRHDGIGKGQWRLGDDFHQTAGGDPRLWRRPPKEGSIRELSVHWWQCGRCQAWTNFDV